MARGFAKLSDELLLMILSFIEVAKCSEGDDVLHPAIAVPQLARILAGSLTKIAIHNTGEIGSLLVATAETPQLAAYFEEIDVFLTCEMTALACRELAMAIDTPEEHAELLLNNESGLAPLLAASPKLKKLSFELAGPPLYPPAQLATSLRWASTRVQNHFQSLTRVEYSGWMPHRWDRLVGFGQLLSTILRLPSLLYLRLNRCKDQLACADWDCVVGSSTVTNLELSHCRFGSPFLIKLLSAPRALQEFWCELDEDSIIPNSGGFAILHEALSLQASTIINMRIAFREDEEECGWAWRMVPLGSLKDFVSLKRLEIAGTILMPGFRGYSDDGAHEEEIEMKDALPQSLHNLLFTSIAPDTPTQLLAFAVAIEQTDFPHLRHIYELSGEYIGHDYGIDAEDEDVLLDALQNVGVTLQFADRVQVGHNFDYRPHDYMMWSECMGTQCGYQNASDDGTRPEDSNNANKEA